MRSSYQPRHDRDTSTNNSEDMSTAPSPRGSTIARGGARWLGVRLLGVVALAVVVGVVTAVQPSVAAAVVSVIALSALLASAVSRPRSLSAPVAMAGKRFRWVIFAWASLLVEPIGHFTAGRTRLTAVAGVPSAENVIELATYGAIGAFALWSLKSNGFGRRPSFAILALPTLALVSAAWSLAPTVTLAFSFELLAAVLLVTLTAAIVRADPDLGRSLVRRTLRLAVQGIALLCVLGLIFRSGWTPGTETAAARFSWPGGYPLYAAAEIGFALLVIVFGGRRDTGFSWRSRAVLLVLFGLCLYLGNTRTAFAGLAVAGLFGYWFVSRGGGLLRRLAGAAAITATVVVLVGSFGGPIGQYLYRGESQQQVFGLNGRVGLWTIGLQQVHSPGRWLVGYGLGGTRVLFASTTSWAGDAHSAWLELLLSLGLLGVVAGAALVVMLAVRLLRAPPGGPLAIRALPILFVYVVAMSPVATGFAAPGPEPGLGFAVLGFCYAATAACERATARAVAKEEVRPAGDLRPAPI